MIPSLGEVQATAMKATRGAGLSWGLAEEAGQATRWLWSRGLDGVGALAVLLQDHDPVDCPLFVGTRLADSGAVAWQGNLRAPLLLLPFLRWQAVKLCWAGGEMGVVAGDAVLSALPGNGPVAMKLEAAEPQGKSYPLGPRHEVDPDAWKLLKRLEGRTYAPPSEASRAGAGAGMTDND